MSGRAVLLTGASGAIGERLASVLAQRGWAVRGAVRDPESRKAAFPRMSWYQYDIDGSPDAASLDRCDALVHLAWATCTADPQAAFEANVEGARKLFQAARDAGVRQIVFVSSMSAHERAVSAYGRGKLVVERLLDPERDLVVRPGFVLANGGVFARLEDTLRRVPAVPLFYGGHQPIQTIGVDDLCTGIASALDLREHGRLVLAHPQVLTISELYRKILIHLGQPKKLMVQLPGTPALWLLRLAERAHLKLPMTSENLLGLKGLESGDVAADLQRIGLKPKSCDEVLRSLAR